MLLGLFGTGFKNVAHGKHTEKNVVIIGGGPAGLTAGYQLSGHGIRSIVLEKDTVVGGLSKTLRYQEYHFDIGGHRFFTKVPTVQAMWREVLPDGNFLRRKRLSRIYYEKTFFHYPLRPLNALAGLGLWNSLLILLSYLHAHVFPQRPAHNFERWVSNRFGHRLYTIFFKTYTEKVWGMPAKDIAADWASQRIQGLSLIVALKNAFLNRKQHTQAIAKTLIDSFEYPKRGPGMMWEAVADRMAQRGGQMRLGADVETIHWSTQHVDAITIRSNGNSQVYDGTHFISSMPLRELIEKCDPAPPENVRNAVGRLRYRDLLIVALTIDRSNLFPDQWVYIHDPAVLVGRIQNVKNWSIDMVPDPTKTLLGLEYFCFEDDRLWSMPDQDLLDLGRDELRTLGLLGNDNVEGGTVVRVPKAYPVYDAQYRQAVETTRGFLNQLENLQVIGRNGMHKYNNQDHSMVTAMLAVENILGAQHDLWRVNVDQEYHEEMPQQPGNTPDDLTHLAPTQPLVPMPVVHDPTSEQQLILAFAHIDKLALGIAFGVLTGLFVCVLTLGLIVKGGENIGAHLQLLGQFFIGYTVSIPGAFIGLAYGILWGFIWGWLFAYLRNVVTGFMVYLGRKKAEDVSFREFFDHF